MRHLGLLLAMFVVLVLAFGLDIAAAFIRAETLRTFAAWWILWLYDVVELAYAISVVAFGWLFLFKGAKSAMVSSIVLIVGLLSFFSLQLWTLFPNLAIESFLGPFGRFAIASPLTYLFHTGALFAVMGTAGLLRAIARFRATTHAQVPSHS